VDQAWPRAKEVRPRAGSTVLSSQRCWTNPSPTAGNSSGSETASQLFHSCTSGTPAIGAICRPAQSDLILEFGEQGFHLFLCRCTFANSGVLTKSRARCLVCDLIAFNSSLVVLFLFAWRFSGDSRWKGSTAYSILTALLMIGVSNSLRSCQSPWRPGWSV
jgi:hypothetical protein